MRLNGPWRQRSLLVFMAIVIAHLAEHIVQAFQVYVLRWPVHQARGVLGGWSRRHRRLDKPTRLPVLAPPRPPAPQRSERPSSLPPRMYRTFETLH